MKTFSKITLLFLTVLVLAFAFPSPAFAQSPDDDGKVVFGGTYTLRSGQTLDGDLAIFGGAATIEEGATVNGSIVVTGGTLEISGEVDGDVTAIGGAINLTDTAVLHGDVFTVGGAVNQSANAEIEGEIITGQPNNFNFNIPDRSTMPRIMRPSLGVDFSPIFKIFWGTFQALAVAALAMLVVLMAPAATGRAANAIAVQPVLSGGFGILTVIVAFLALGLLAITIILSPFALIGLLVLAVALLFGWVALGLEIGRRLETMFKTNWSEPVSAGLGVLVISLAVVWIGWIPCVGWALGPILSMIGLGAVVLTRFGTRGYIPPAPVVVSAPPAVQSTTTTTTVVTPPPAEPEPPLDRSDDLPPSL